MKIVGVHSNLLSIVFTIQTPVSMNILDVHMNAYIFLQPKEFQPERWLSPAAKTGNLKPYLVPFAKGSRQYLGLEKAAR